MDSSLLGDLDALKKELQDIRVKLEVLKIQTEVNSIKADLQAVVDAASPRPSASPRVAAPSPAAAGPSAAITKEVSVAPAEAKKEVVASSGSEFVVGEAETQGVRDEMEDQHTLVAPVPGLTARSAFIGVYDGHGGTEAAEYCAKKLHKRIFKSASFATDRVAAITSAFIEVDKQFLDDAAMQLYESGCTVLVSLVDGADLWVACAGDCRAILSTKGSNEPQQLNIEHKPTLPAERKRIEAAGFIVRDKRVDGQLAVSRAIGDPEFKLSMSMGMAVEKLAVTPVPDVKHFTLTGNEEFLVVACDGLWESLSNFDVISFLRRALEKIPQPWKKENLDAVTNQLVKYAVKKGSTDNITCLVVVL